jgi:hypothetical protein
MFRMGVGFNRRGMRGASGFFGASWTPYGEGGVFGEYNVPLASRFAVSLAARGGKGAENRDTGFGIGLRYQLGR